MRSRTDWARAARALKRALGGAEFDPMLRRSPRALLVVPRCGRALEALLAAAAILVAAAAASCEGGAERCRECRLESPGSGGAGAGGEGGAFEMSGGGGDAGSGGEGGVAAAGGGSGGEGGVGGVGGTASVGGAGAGGGGAGGSAAHAVQVTTSGLAGTGLVLENNGGDDLSVAKNGTASFATSLATGTTYAVTVKTQPTSPAQTCVVGKGSGTVASADITDVTVTCTTNTYKIGGTVSGLAGTGLVLQDNGGDDLAVTANGAFVFATKVASGAAYAVTVKTQPGSPVQSCAVSAGAGIVRIGDVSGVLVRCVTSTYAVGGAVTGLAGAGLVLQDNGGDDLAVSASGPFTFATELATGAAYAVTVKTHPSGQSCAVSRGSGTVGSADVTTVGVTCTAASVKILLDCSPGAAVLNTFTGAGCHGPVGAGGASYVVMGATPRATLWSGPNCTGCSYVVTGDLSFCGGTGYPGFCGAVNDNVQSVSIP